MQTTCLANNELLIGIEEPFSCDVDHQDVIGGDSNSTDCESICPRSDLVPASSIPCNAMVNLYDCLMIYLHAM